MAKVRINIGVNGKRYELAVEPYETLLDVLRNKLGLTGTKMGCAKGECGACTVNIDGKAILSCLTLAVRADGKEILTIEGLLKGTELHPLQEAFVKNSALQCGYCTPGMIMAAKALLDHEHNPSEEVVRKTLSSNLCRCTGYDRLVQAVLDAARSMRGQHGR
ncbi:(2Fe-2S)-binding protein [Chloroflexota bacterium]